MFGVQTTYTTEQAMERSGGTKGNRGYDVTVAALTMVDVLKQARDEIDPPA
jgi:6,7-dimethyl-8-ribityllumazine synthase